MGYKEAINAARNPSADVWNQQRLLGLADKDFLDKWEKPKVIGDFSKLDAALESQEITQEEYQKFFEETREHGMQNAIFPFCVGGSDSPIIMGVSPWTSSQALYYQKFGLASNNNIGKEYMFLAGHVYEQPIRELFTFLSGVETAPCPLQMMHKDTIQYPHLVANIDGLCIENGKIGGYEGKTTNHNSPTWAHFKNGKCPIYYEMQVRFYMEVCNLDFWWICCSCGLGENDIRYLRIDRDRAIGKMIIDECENFVQNAISGIEPVADNNSLKLEQIAQNIIDIYKPTPKHPDVHLDPSFKASFERLVELENEEKAVNVGMEPFEEKTAEIEKEKEPYKERLKSISEERDGIYKSFLVALKESQNGFIKIGKDIWHVKYDISQKVCFDNSVKQYFKKIYPDVYNDVMNQKKTTPHPVFTIENEGKA